MSPNIFVLLFTKVLLVTFAIQITHDLFSFMLNVLNYATRAPVVSGMVAGVLVLMRLPLKRPARIRRNARSPRSPLKAQASYRGSRVLRPEVWVSRYSITNRQLSRLTP